MDAPPIRLNPPLYWDSNAGWPLNAEAAKRALATWLEVEAHGANASSRHQAGRHARAVWSKATDTILKAINAPTPSRSEKQSQVVVTHSGSEANAMIIRGWIERCQRHGASWTWICSGAEHDSVWEWLAPLRQLPGADVHVVGLDAGGMIDLAQLSASLHAAKGREILVSTQWVNHELGVLQPMQEIRSLVRRSSDVFWHVDAAQAWGKVDVSLALLGADAVAFSGQKLGAGSGSGFAWIRSPEVLVPLIPGSQQQGMRGGSYPLGTALFLAEAIQLRGWSAERENAFRHWRLLMDREATQKFQTRVQILGNRDQRIGGTWMIELKDRQGLGPGAPWTDALDRFGIYVSSGSACSSGSVKNSHIISALLTSNVSKDSLIRCSPLDPPSEEGTFQFFERLSYIWGSI